MRFNMKDIIIDGDPRLRQPSAKVNIPLSAVNLELVRAMVDFVKRSQVIQSEEDVMTLDDDGAVFTGAVGMSAPQFGFNKRIFVYTNLRDGATEYLVIVNPEIVQTSGGLVKLSTGESCLSVPAGEPLKINRTKNIRWNGYLVDPEDGIAERKHMTPVKGYSSIVFQHEYDHLEGTLYIDRVPGVIHGIDPPFKGISFIDPNDRDQHSV